MNEYARPLPSSDVDADLMNLNAAMNPISLNLTEEIFEDIFVFFGKLSADGIVKSLRGKVFERTNTDPNLLVGQRFSETVYWQSSEETSGILEKAIADAAAGDNIRQVLEFRINADEKLLIELVLNPLSDGAKTEIFFCAADVTEREKELEFHKRRSEQLLYAAENADMGLWFLDLVEDKVYSTPKCNELFGVPADKPMTLLSIADTLHPDDRKQVETAILESQKFGKDYDAEFRILHSDGSVHWIATKGKTFLDSDGKPINMMGVVRGITEKKTEAEKLSKIYAREKKARDEAEEANRTKDFFLAIVSHELRSPLNAILGWTRILLTRKVDEDTHRNALETIERSARSQAKLIEDLVDSARIASGRMRLEFRPTNIYDVVKNVVNSQTPAAEAKDITLEFRADNEQTNVLGDMIRLQQVFANIVSNSIKFTPKGGKVEIVISTTDQKVEVLVADNGVGISAETLPNIFLQFAQGDDKISTDRSGLGLGLSISKILVEKHKGKITARSEGTGRGSTFTVELPRIITDQETKSGSGISNPKNAKRLKDVKILIVEDDLDSRQVLQLVLEQAGARVVAAESVSDALSILDASKTDLPDAIVSDLAMPEEDGYALISRVRQRSPDNGGKIPAIALSAFATDENKQNAYDSGFQKYHTKPFEPDNLVNDILSVLG